MSQAKAATSKYNGIARPYAQAAFSTARESQQLTEWAAFLSLAARIATDAQVKKFLANPLLPQTTALNWFKEILQDCAKHMQLQLSAAQTQFLTVLSQNKRLALLAPIFSLFKLYAAQNQRIHDVRVVTAVPVDENFNQLLANNLVANQKETVSIHNEVDPAIGGGAVIYVGDKVIDASVRGKLSRLLDSLLR